MFKLKLKLEATAAVALLLAGCAGSDLIVQTPCGGTVGLFPEGHPITVAARAVQARFPTAFDAQRSRDPTYIDAHPQDYVGHSELAGFGVTFVQSTGATAPAHCAEGTLDRPSLLFFDKRAGRDKHKQWNIIGMGFHYEWGHGCRKDNGDGDRDFADGGEITECSKPFILDLAESAWLVHEAGYHELASGDFTCADNADVKTDNLTIDSGMCNLVTKDDLKKKVGPVAHGRAWTVHLFFDPESGRPTFTVTDPWCRQSANAKAVGACAFRRQDANCCGS